MKELEDMIHIGVEEAYPDELNPRQDQESQEPFDVLKNICFDHGCVFQEHIPVLEKHYPTLSICAKMGYGPRFCVDAKDFRAELEKNISSYKNQGLNQYVREVFIPASDLDLLRKVFKF